MFAPVLEHPMVPRGQEPPRVITDNSALAHLIGELRTAGSFGYDSEFIGEHTYHPKLCVIQVATTTHVSLIDPMSGLELQPFWLLLADASVEKIVHAGLQDLEPALRHTGQPPRNVFDAQIAAAFAGFHYPIGMGKLAQALIGADPHQGVKFSQWDRRPLSAMQLRYAADDVRYLPLLRHTLREKLIANGNEAWAMEECASLSDPSLYQFDAASQRVRIRGADALSRRKTALLRALVAWREELAIQHDVPPRAMIKDGVLYELARFPAQTLADLDRVKGLPRPIEDAYGEHILQMTKHALEGPPPPPDPAASRRKRKRIDWNAVEMKVEELWALVEKKSAERAVHPTLAASKKELAKWVEARTLDEPTGTLRVARGWRWELLREALETA